MMGHQCILLQRQKMQRRLTTRRQDSTSRLMQSVFHSDHVLSEVEQEYVTAAAVGDLEGVQRAIMEHHVNINCQDHMCRSALELALVGDHLPVVEYLMPRTNLQCVEDALLYAIDRDHLRYCELILDHPLYKNQRIRMANSTAFYHQEMTGPRIRPDTTPIVLAGQNNNFRIIKLLMERGSSIKMPHDYFCDCTECTNMRVYDSVKYSRTRLSTFAALTSPAYISLSSDDPILTAFLLSHQMKQLADIEKEYKVRIMGDNNVAINHLKLSGTLFFCHGGDPMV